MKTFTFIIAIFIGFTAFGQEKVEESVPMKNDQGVGITVRGPVVYFIDGIKQPAERKLNTVDYFVLTTKIIQPTQTNELPNGTMPLSKELPYVHTIRGTVYTADHLKYAPRR